LVLIGLAEVAGGIMLSITDDGWGWRLAGGISLAAGVVLFVLNEIWNRQTAGGIRAERANFTLLLADALLPMIGRLSRMPAKDTDGRMAALETVLADVAMAAPALLPHADRMRVVVYRLEPAVGRRKRRLVPETYGRNDNAKKLSEGDGGRGDAVFAVLTSGKTQFVADVTKANLPGGSRSGKGYRTFISAAVVADGSAYGVLNVDAPQPGDLDEGDKEAVEVLAGMLGLAFAIAEKAS